MDVYLRDLSSWPHWQQYCLQDAAPFVSVFFTPPTMEYCNIFRPVGIFAVLSQKSVVAVLASTLKFQFKDIPWHVLISKSD